MYFRKQFQYVAIGCFCTLAGVLLSSSVLPLFGKSGEDVIYEHIACKSLAIINDNSEIIALLGKIGDENYGTLTLLDESGDNSFFVSNSMLTFRSNKQEVVNLGVTENSGSLLLNNSKNDGMLLVSEKDESGFAIGIFGPKGVGIGAGASLSIEGNKGQLLLFGENEEILFGRGKINYGQ